MTDKRSKEIIREIGALAAWIFFLWLGFDAISRADTWALGIYVLVASTALAGAVAGFWRINSN
jgi:hypothetical protein